MSKRPRSSVALLLMAAIWLVLKGREGPNPVITVALGAVLALLYFYRQNMILAIVALAPAYVLAVGNRRTLHAILLAAACTAVSAAILALFPHKLAEYAVRLPGLTPALRAAGILPPDFELILSTTDTPLSWAFEPERISWQDPYNAFLLPYLGTILASAALFFLRGRTRVWLLVPAFFLFFAATHYVGSVGYCATCILTYTNYFVGVGALAGGLTFAALWSARERRNLWPLDGVLPACAAAILLNVFAPAAVISSQPAIIEGFTSFPAPMLRQVRPIWERDEMESLAREIDHALPPGKPTLVLHNLPSITYAVALSGRVLPPQSLNLWQSYREVRAGLTSEARRETGQALLRESLWTDDTLALWISSDYDAVVYQEDLAPRPALEAELDRHFDLVKRTDYRGWKVRLYARRPRTETEAVGSAQARVMVCELEFVRRGFGPGC